MKEKILELIHKELENVGGENIFHNCNNPWGWTNYGAPFKVVNLTTKHNCDTSEQMKPEVLEFTLNFEDGEPSIRVYTKWDYNCIDELYKTKYFGLKKFWTTVTTYTFTTKVSCGHISFDLSDEESVELLKLTKESYSKHCSLRDELKDKVISKKIKKRLKKYQNKLGE